MSQVFFCPMSFIRVVTWTCVCLQGHGHIPEVTPLKKMSLQSLTIYKSEERRGDLWTLPFYDIVYGLKLEQIITTSARSAMLQPCHPWRQHSTLLPSSPVSLGLGGVIHMSLLRLLLLYIFVCIGFGIFYPQLLLPRLIIFDIFNFYFVNFL